MGEAKRRGTFAQRRADAVQAGRVPAPKRPAALLSARNIWALLLGSAQDGRRRDTSAQAVADQQVGHTGEVAP